MEFNILPDEQKALRKGHRGCHDALMIDSMIVESAMVNKSELSVAWVDYQKAYDRVPHGWLLTVLRAINAPRNVRKCVRRLMRKWVTVFSVGRRKIVRVEITLKRGLFQGDALSPLLFCLSILPMSHALRETGKGFLGYTLVRPISHLFFMDDLKVYAGNKGRLGRVLDLVDDVSEAMSMTLGLRKCAVAHLIGVCREGEDITLKGLRTIKSLTDTDAYKYLGVAQLFEPKYRVVKEKLVDEYLVRLRKIWSSDLNAKHKVHATNTWAVALFRYFFTSFRWYQNDLLKLDVQTRTVLRRFHCHQLSASVERLYLHRK